MMVRAPGRHHSHQAILVATDGMTHPLGQERVAAPGVLQLAENGRWLFSPIISVPPSLPVILRVPLAILNGICHYEW